MINLARIEQETMKTEPFQWAFINNLFDSKDADALASSYPSDHFKVGNSSLIVRSENSWHAVSRVVPTCKLSRRSMTVTFYQPDSPSTMWKEDDPKLLHDYKDPEKHSFFGFLKRG